MTRRLIVLGTGGNALDVLDVVDAINRTTPTWEIAGYLDDAQEPGTLFHGRPVLGPLTRAREFDESFFVNAIGSDKSFRRRAAIVTGTGLGDDSFATLIHPGACVSTRMRIGPGTVVNFGALIGGEVEVGRHVSLGPGCVIGHNTTIGDFAMVAPGAVVSGFVRLGVRSYLGAGSAIKQRVSVGEGALVGLGAVVVRDVSAGMTVIGNPARPLVRSESVVCAGVR